MRWSIVLAIPLIGSLTSLSHAGLWDQATNAIDGAAESVKGKADSHTQSADEKITGWIGTNGLSQKITHTMDVTVSSWTTKTDAMARKPKTKIAEADDTKAGAEIAATNIANNAKRTMSNPKAILDDPSALK